MVKREIWVDNVKAVACVFVAFIHFYQSMVRSGVLGDDAFFYWLNQTVYSFIPPSFFLCSGYLYQKTARFSSLRERGSFIFRKLIELGVPYFSFTLLLLAIKSMFKAQINMEEGGVIETLFFHPTSPFWYLYTLFFLFLLIPALKSKKSMLLFLAASFCLKIARITLFPDAEIPFVVSALSDNAIWFIGGMAMQSFSITEKFSWKITALGALFLPFSVILAAYAQSGLAWFGLGILGCMTLASGMYCFFRERNQMVFFDFIVRYNMPIFLLHGFFAATMRSVLFAAGITAAAVHFPLGYAASVFGPTLAGWFMRKTKYPEFFMYPGKFIRLRRERA